jgi:hypothetical protein
MSVLMFVSLETKGGRILLARKYSTLAKGAPTSAEEGVGGESVRIEEEFVGWVKHTCCDRKSSH